MSDFHPLRTFAHSDIIRVVKPIQTIAPQAAQFATAGAFALIVAILCAVSFLRFSTVVTKGRVVKAEVLRLGMDPASGVNGGNVPILSVRLPDGSIRDVQATWADVNGCKPGRWISLLQDGLALQVGQPGCSSRH